MLVSQLHVCAIVSVCVYDLPLSSSLLSHCSSVSFTFKVRGGCFLQFIAFALAVCYFVRYFEY